MFSMDQYTEYYKARHGSSSFVTDFIKISYELYGENKTTKVIDKTPKELTDSWVLEIPEEVNGAKNIYLVVGIRGSVYKMTIKL